MKRYSDIYITDDNSDEEREKLCVLLGQPYSAGSFEEKNTILGDKRFEKEYSKQFDCEVLIAQVIRPNFAIDCVAPIIETTIAYEFANGFMVFGYRDSFYD